MSFSLLFGVIPLMAQENGKKCAMIETSQGDLLEYYISSHPRLMHDNDKVTLTSDEETREFFTTDIKKVYTSIATIKIIYTLDGNLYKSYYHHAGVPLKSEPAPAKEGYSFSGWDNEPLWMPDYDITIAGLFIINKYKLTYQVDGDDYKACEVEFGSPITPEPEPTKEGHTFSGWSEIPKTMPSHDVIITGTFNINKYKLTYIVDGEEYKSMDIEYGTVITPEEEPTKEGYSFMGWSQIPETMPAHDVRITGTFKVNKYNVNYFVDNNPYYTEKVDFGAIVIPPTVQEREGYDFAWGHIPDTMPAYDISIYGRYTIKTSIDNVSIRQGSGNNGQDDFFFTGLQPGENVYVFNISGERIIHTHASNRGDVTIPCVSLTKGIYIIKTNSRTIKITRK